MEEKSKVSEAKEKKKGEWAPYIKVGVTAFLTIAAAILLFFVLFRFDEISAKWNKLVKAAEPIIFGLIFAYLLMPVKNLIEKYFYNILSKRIKQEEKVKKLAKNFSVIGSIIFLLVIIAILIAILVPAVISSIAGFIENIQGYIKSFMLWFSESRVGSMIFGSESEAEIEKITDPLIEWAKTEFLPQVQSYISKLQGYLFQITSGVVSMFKSILNFIIGIIVMVYVMSIKDQLVGQSKKIIYAMFPVKKANVIIDTIRKSNEIFGGFIIGKIIDSAIIGVICYIGCLVLRMPSSLLVAVIVGFTNIIPFFGPFLGAFVTVPLVLIQSPIHGLYLAIFILILQQVDGNIIGPKILGDTTGLSSFWVMFSILIAGGIFGFFGMLLGVPTFAVIYYIIQQIIKVRMRKKKLPETTEEYVKLVSIDEQTMDPLYKSEDKES